MTSHAVTADEPLFRPLLGFRGAPAPGREAPAPGRGAPAPGRRGERQPGLLSAREIAEGLHLDSGSSAPGRPYVVLNMISTADGRATMGGRTAALGNPADRRLFHALRAVVDGVMVGAGTARAEHYGRIVRDETVRARRRERGLEGEPLACIVSGRLALEEEVPLLHDPDARVAILTPSPSSLTQSACRTTYVRAQRDGHLDLGLALRELAGRLGIGRLLCEGGPHLNAQLLAEGLVDELFLALAPKLAGGDSSSESLRITAGVDLDPVVDMKLVEAYEQSSYLFLRYRSVASGG